MKNTLKLVTAAFCMFVFSSNVQAITLDQEVKVEQSEPKQGKKCCKSKKSCNKDEKSCSKDKKSCNKDKKSCSKDKKSCSKDKGDKM